MYIKKIAKIEFIERGDVVSKILKILEDDGYIIEGRIIDEYLLYKDVTGDD